MITTPPNLVDSTSRITVPNPNPIDLNLFNWKVITADRLPSNDNWVYYGLTPKQYEILARNMAEILRWVEEAQWRLDFYKKEATNERGSNGN